MSPRRRYPSTESDLALRTLLSAVMDGCAKTREQIAAELSQLIGRRITRSMLNDYTATTKTAARFPAAYVPGLCAVTGDDRLQLFLLSREQKALIVLGKRAKAFLDAGEDAVLSQRKVPAD